MTVPKIRGRPVHTVHIFRENGRTFSTLQDIYNKLTSTFANTSSNGNYSEEFKKMSVRQNKPESTLTAQMRRSITRTFRSASWRLFCVN